MKSRQEQAWDKLLETFFKLINTSKDIPNKEDMKAELHEIFDYPVVRENMVQAFSNFMWEMDETIERKVYDELEHLVTLIGMIGDPEDPNTLAIQSALTQIVAVGGVKPEEMEEAEIDSLTEGDEFDDSRPVGL